MARKKALPFDPIDEAARQWARRWGAVEQMRAVTSLMRAQQIVIGELGERLQVHPTSVTSIVRRLEAAGLVKRTPHPVDGRAVLCEITEAGRELVERATADLVAADFAVRGLSEEQLAMLWSVLEPLRRNAGDFI